MPVLVSSSSSCLCHFAHTKVNEKFVNILQIALRHYQIDYVYHVAVDQSQEMMNTSILNLVCHLSI
uniref:Leukocyte receptor cluster member 8 homolog isoform X3 n=1 Tax=Rhizophora mucronata TaxID=61149 RepID=A0A2P2LEG3_RHIMU